MIILYQADSRGNFHSLHSCRRTCHVRSWPRGLTDAMRFHPMKAASVGSTPGRGRVRDYFQFFRVILSRLTEPPWIYSGMKSGSGAHEQM